MSLPRDICRCQGARQPVCRDCRRREAVNSPGPQFMTPPVDILTGKCAYLIKATASDGV